MLCHPTRSSHLNSQKLTAFLPKTNGGQAPAGFTLVETVIALGVVAYAMLGILGLVPVGLSHFRDAMSTTAESQIIQSLSNDILLMESSELLSTYQATSKVYAYNDEGQFLVDATDSTRAFEVRVSVGELTAPNVATTAGQTIRIEVRPTRSAKGSKKYSFVVPKD